MITRLKKWLREEHGSVLITTAISIGALIASSGLAVDLARMQMVRLKLQTASDAAVLAAAYAPETTTPAERATIANVYFNLNYPETYLDVPRPTPVISVTNRVELTASVSINTLALGAIGINTLTPDSRSVAIIGNNKAGVDLVFAIDVSVSMNRTDVGATNYREPPTPALLATSVSNLAAQCNSYYYEALNWVDGTQTATGYVHNTGGYTNPTCAPSTGGLLGATRLNSARYSAVSLANKVMDAGPENRVGVLTFSNFVRKVQPLTTDRTAVTNFLDTMGMNQGTNSWAALKHIQDYEVPQFQDDHMHVVVLLTDGKNTNKGHLHWSPGIGNRDEYGCGGPGTLGTQQCILTNTDSVTVCSALKAQGVIIFTIGFGQEITSPTNTAYATADEARRARELLAACATPSTGGQNYAYLAPDAAALNAAFENILQSLQKTRLSQ